MKFQKYLLPPEVVSVSVHFWQLKLTLRLTISFMVANIVKNKGSILGGFQKVFGTALM